MFKTINIIRRNKEEEIFNILQKMEYSIISWLEQSYHINALSILQLNGGNWANTFDVESNQGSLIVKILETTRSSPTEEIQTQILFYLASKNIIVRNPIPNIHGNCNTFCQFEGNNYQITVFQKIQGHVIEEHMSLLTSNVVEILGENLARFHNELSKGGFDSHYKLWNQQENLFTQFDFGQVDNSIVDRYHSFFNKLSHEPMQCQLIHGDMHFANIVLQKDPQEIGFIDFDDMILGHPVMDLSVLILDYAIMTLKSNDEIIQKFVVPLLSGYFRLKPLTKEEILMIPLILKVLELNLYIQCYEIRDSEAVWIKNFYVNRTQSVSRDDYIILSREELLVIYGKIQ
ncbi:phosphotransferase enzyme family protein [Candidatus Lokiarchaeum ossiferum]|uniref:phosphotransferase enzyme family protein n=1 Tax=Candidatus Lokiarchaeum ossiferum TaxID=2951803 RepID=UPI00352F8566